MKGSKLYLNDGNRTTFRSSTSIRRQSLCKMPMKSAENCGVGGWGSQPGIAGFSESPRTWPVATEGSEVVDQTRSLGPSTSRQPLPMTSCTASTLTHQQKRKCLNVGRLPLRGGLKPWPAVAPVRVRGKAGGDGACFPVSRRRLLASAWPFQSMDPIGNGRSRERRGKYPKCLPAAVKKFRQKVGWQMSSPRPFYDTVPCTPCKGCLERALVGQDTISMCTEDGFEWGWTIEIFHFENTVFSQGTDYRQG